MTRTEMITMIRRTVAVTNKQPSYITVRFGMPAGTTDDEAKAVLREALRGGE